MLLAEAALPIIGRLFRDKSVVTIMYGRPMIEKAPIEILREHRWVRRVEESGLSIRDTFPLLEELAKMALRPCRVDIGKLGVAWLRAGRTPDAATFVLEQLK